VLYGYKSRLRVYNERVERGDGEDLDIKGATPHAFDETEGALIGLTPLSPLV
jgi:hypothetical protein